MNSLKNICENCTKKNPKSKTKACIIYKNIVLVPKEQWTNMEESMVKSAFKDGECKFKCLL